VTHGKRRQVQSEDSALCFFRPFCGDGILYLLSKHLLQVRGCLCYGKAQILYADLGQ